MLCILQMQSCRFGSFGGFPKECAGIVFPFLHSGRFLCLQPHDPYRNRFRLLPTDWSPDGASVRASVYNAIIQRLTRWLPNPVGQHPPTVFVPGSGLGRLAFEIALRGYAVSGLEVSGLLLAACYHVLQPPPPPNPGAWRFHPYLHRKCSNEVFGGQRLEEASFPDIQPQRAYAATKGSLSFEYGDFNRLCKQV